MLKRRSWGIGPWELRASLPSLCDRTLLGREIKQSSVSIRTIRLAWAVIYVVVRRPALTLQQITGEEGVLLLVLYREAIRRVWCREACAARVIFPLLVVAILLHNLSLSPVQDFTGKM